VFTARQSTHRRTALSLCVGLALLSVACGGSVPIERSATVDGAEFSVQAWVYSPEVGDALFEEMLDRVTRFSKMTATASPSDLAEINRGARSGFHTIDDPDLYRCILLAYDWAKASRGASDPTLGPLHDAYRFAVERGRIPGRAEIDSRLDVIGWRRMTVAHEAKAIRLDNLEAYLDLAGVRRGFALDLAARALATSGVHGGLLRFGSTTYAWVPPPDQEDWPVPILDPSDRGSTLMTLRTSERAISVTGSPADSTAIDDRYLYERLDGRTGLPAVTQILAAVALADSAAEADAIADAFYVGGYRPAAALLERSRRVEAVLYLRTDEGPTLLASASLRGRIEPHEKLAAAVGDRIRYILPPQSIAVLPDVR